MRLHTYIIMLEYLIFVVCALLCYIYFQPKSSLDAMPGPKPSLLIGNALQLSSGQPYINLKTFARKYGGIFKLRLFTTPVVVVSDPELLHTMLVKKSADFAGRPHTYGISLFSDGYSGVAFTDAGPEHKGRRKVVSTFLKQFGTGIQKVEEISQIATGDMIDMFVKCDSHPLDVKDYLDICVTDATAILVTGDIISSDDTRRIRDSIGRTMEATSPNANSILLDIFPQLRFFGNSCYRAIQDYISVRDHYIHKWIDSEPTNGFISFLMLLSNEELRDSFLHEQKSKLSTIWDFLAAGITTTSTTLTCLMNVLCQHPVIQKKLQREVLDIIGSARKPTMKDRENMPYMKATLLEIGRFASVAPLSIPHKTMKDTDLGQYTIPKDTAIWPNLWTLHHDEELWDEPFTFNPDRFLDENGQVVPPDHPNRRNVMPFGAGHRVCVGEVFALSRMFLITARILQNFTILPETSLEAQPSCDPRDMTFGATSAPPPFKVRMIPING